MTMQLVVISGPDRGRVFKINDGEGLVIGRGQDSDTQLNDRHVSRVHCHLEVEGGTVRLTHSGGSGGTILNGQIVEQREIKLGDVFRIGETELRLQMEGVQDESTLMSPGIGPGRSLPEPSTLKDLLGQTLSHYRLDGVISTGVTDMVFKAHDEKNDQVVAVKVLEPGYAGDEENMQRFVRAMKTMLPIRHENIVSILEAGKNGPHCWTAMEYVDGDNMADIIQRIGTVGQLDWKEAFRVAVHITRALEAAYEHKIVHRNITPTNIIQRKSDKVAKLGDLMLAKALEGTLARQVTQPGELIGDVAYMSPEGTRSQSEVDCRSDLYGLGATIYAMLTARPPFEADSLPELISKIRKDEPERPKKYQLGIPELFEDLVMRLLAKRQEDRYQTPTELLADLERIGKFQGELL